MNATLGPRDLSAPAPLSSGAGADAAPSAASLRQAGKRFGGTIALQDVSFDLRPGEVLALLGENGAGKSTCVKLLAGVHVPDSGSVLLDGRPLDHPSPAEARRRGVAVMHQHPGLFGDLAVYENIFMGHVPRTALGTIDDRRMREEARELLRTVGLSCEPDEPLHRLRTSEQQLVEIARALSARAKVLIMDEPTASISEREVARLFAVVEDLKSRGVAMMFVGHRMEEIYRIADRIAVLRDGRLITVQPAAELDRDRAVQAMIGRPLSAIYPAWPSNPGAEVLSVEGLTRAGAFADVSFSVRAGEVVGLGGLVGSGRTEIARALFGIDRAEAGRIIIDGKTVTFADPGEAMAAGIAYVSEDRLGQSLVMDFSILTNASVPVIGRSTMAGLVMRRRELALVKPHLERLRLKFASYDQPVSTLSGGNQQKVVLSKWLATRPRILILDEPTQGIDVQSKAEVHAMIAELAQQGLAIILISSELPELIGMCDRMIVLREGRVTARFSRGDADQERIIRAATDVEEVRDRQAAAAEPPPGPGAAAAVPAARHEAASVPAWRRLVARREFGLACVIALVVLPVSLINPRMLSGPNLTALAMDAALLSIVAAAQMLVIVTRNIDLSVASVIGLTAYGSASFMRDFPEAPVLAGVAVACGLGLACGLLNGLVVTLGRVPSIVVTLGSLAAFRGLNSMWTGGKQISADQVPQAWLDMSTATVLGIPAAVLIAIATLVLISLAVRRLPVGRELYAIGSNPDGAALIGIRRTALVIGTFAIAGLLAGFDGALWASRYATIDPRLATGFELTVIAAVVVGGVAIRGGAGTILGVTFGALALLIIQNGLTLVRVEPLWLQGVYGVVILLAIGVDALVTRKARHAGARG
ncbi:ATP-binding cassette domain-containing protein [Labrys wisconsinensis]|uniref:Ribose transport system ATP-binding protein/rhamnose transport system ATP-binding protein n=1 Tax=Labrys wisconsinensis TaxID=425677 RepID=A0ABU0J1K4_9HYPH|nr:ATP-binding cassette domain-containing protein [Labrys wisconsinensis]MDQ0468123.1 ribose transport system ATP-binding protein/rhamnose transport system ATP-binding protein [Labrys wisconsinensis]